MRAEFSERRGGGIEAANWLLIVDNLSDVAHPAFVHTDTPGGYEEYAYKTKPVAIEKLDDGFRVERWHTGAEPPPFLRKVKSNKTDKVDRRNIGRMIVPGIFLLNSMFARAGQGREKGVQVPGTRQVRNAQFMTPEPRCSTHFFWNYLHDFDIDNPNIALSLRNSLEEAFNEDWPSSRRSRRCSMPIRTINCPRSAPMRR